MKKFAAYIVFFAGFISLLLAAGRYPQAFAIFGAMGMMVFVNLLIRWITGVDCEAGLRKALFGSSATER